MSAGSGADRNRSNRNRSAKEEIDLKQKSFGKSSKSVTKRKRTLLAKSVYFSKKPAKPSRASARSKQFKYFSELHSKVEQALSEMTAENAVQQLSRIAEEMFQLVGNLREGERGYSRKLIEFRMILKDVAENITQIEQNPSMANSEYRVGHARMLAQFMQIERTLSELVSKS